LKLHIVARGKIGRCAEADLIERYARRINWPFQISELPDAGGKAPPPPAGAIIIGLDERGAVLSSAELAKQFGDWRDNGVREVRFLIGAANGLTDEERTNVTLLLSFGRATWPHMLVRAMLVEQLWRAVSIIAGQPYHREW
jgi:23S rRNA (pseudouridine1915-N3)-methyltransferase